MMKKLLKRRTAGRNNSQVSNNSFQLNSSERKQSFCVPLCVEIKAKYEKKMELLPQELDNMRKNQTSEREDHWNSHIAALIEDHNKAFSEANTLVNHMRRDVDANCLLKV